ncbi:MAG TPA: DJ-1/PfpI family protein [Symbiobacteriaceae bacterium]|nr:DJ-1/PfpI family protein [Symbiobacteriaceae bacterium]
MNKLLVLIYPTFSEFEVAVATTILGRKYEILSLGLDDAPVTGEGGFRCIPHVTVGNANPDEYAGLIIPGAPEFRPVIECPALDDLVRSLYAAGKPLAAICGGPMVLGKAGILAERRYTTSLLQEHRAFLGIPEATFVDQDLVQDGHVLTAKGPAYVEFGLAAARLFGYFRDDEHFAEVARWYRNTK